MNKTDKAVFRQETADRIEDAQRELKAVTAPRTVAEKYKTPKKAIVCAAIDLVNTAEQFAEVIEKDGFGKARALLDDINAISETLEAQLETL